MIFNLVHITFLTPEKHKQALCLFLSVLKTFADIFSALHGKQGFSIEKQWNFSFSVRCIYAWEGYSQV